MLAQQHSIEHCIIHFVALEVVSEIPKLYFESMKGDEKLFEVFEHPILITKRGRDFKWADRSCGNKIGRLIYKTFRCIYISVVFYMVPFAVILVNYNAAMINKRSTDVI